VNILIDNKSGAPIYDQIYSQIKSQIIRGALREDEMLPSIRGLAKDLRISFITTILDVGNASSHIKENPTESPRDAISMAGARTLVEELAKKLPKVEWGEF